MNIDKKTIIDNFIELSTKEDISPLIKKIELILVCKKGVECHVQLLFFNSDLNCL